MKKLYGVTGIVLVCAMLLVLTQVNVAVAQSSPYTGLDIVFIVDQSGSMGGSSIHPDPNDPQSLRFFGVAFALSWLGQDQLLIHPEAIYRVAVVNFGTDPQTVNFGTDNSPYYWETIAPKTAQQWRVQEAAVKPKVGPNALSQPSLGSTNFLKAFDEAHKLFAQLDTQGGISGTHKRAIIVLTDGQPYVSENTDVAGHMRQLIANVEANSPLSRYDIYVVALNDADVHYWNQSYANYWAQVTGDSERAQLVEQNETDVGLRFQEILSKLTQDLPRISDVALVQIESGPQIIPPYLREVEFTFFKAITSEVTTVIDPLGQNVKGLATTQVSGETEPIESVRISNPEPGSWTVAVPVGSQTKITMQQILALGRLEKPVGIQYQFVPLPVVYQLIDTANNPLPQYQDPRYQLQITTTIQASGQTWPIYLRSAGQSRYEAEFVPTHLGSHNVHVRAMSQDLNGSPVTVFEGNLSPFDARLLSAESRMPGNLLTQYISTTLHYGLIDNTNQTASISAPIDVQAIITDSQNNVQVIPLNIRYGSDLIGAFTPTAEGIHTVQLVATASDSRGQNYTVFDIMQNSLDVTRPTLQIQLSTPPYRQYKPVDITYQFLDAHGSPLIFTASYAPQLNITLTQQGETVQSILPQQTAPGVYTANFSPTLEGEQTLISTFKLTDLKTNQEITLIEESQEIFVLATTLVNIKATDATLGRQSVRSVIFQPRPLFIELEVAANGKPLNLADVIQGASNVLFELQVLDKEGRDRSSELTWISTNQPGLFRAEGETFKHGRYTVRVNAVAPLKADYMYTSPSLQFDLHRVENPVLVGLAIVSLVVTIIAAIIIVRKVQKINELQKHPCRGYITLVDSTGKVLLPLDLEAVKRPMNEQIFEVAELGEASVSLIKTLIVRCETDQDSTAGIITVEAIMQDGDRVGPHKLTPHGDPLSVQASGTWLFKDLAENDLDKIPV